MWSVVENLKKNHDRNVVRKRHRVRKECKFNKKRKTIFWKR